ncbi:hypothetical protein CQW23_21659 [Capsicum baccatum]|uniref:Uncharacterized protein n=1 Tax=Capsicum baccatum TaxID=33114 RepID=A0A2G2VYN0_CAPBA|nr:hypothetical protein CQW23_21659 [Capsicum baccatum]
MLLGAMHHDRDGALDFENYHLACRRDALMFQITYQDKTTQTDIIEDDVLEKILKTLTTFSMKVDSMGDFMGEWLNTPRGWKLRSFIKVTLPIAVHRNSSYDELVASINQSGDLDCASSNMVISYLMHSREKVNPTIINNNAHVSLYMMDVDANGFRPILRINLVDKSFEGSMNSSPS